MNPNFFTALHINVKKLHPDAVIPKYAKDGDAGLDLTAVSVQFEGGGGGRLVYDTGLAFEIPKGYAGLVFPRSSIFKTDLRLANGVGIIDSGYRNSIKFIFDDIAPDFTVSQLYKVGDRIGQLMIIPHPIIYLTEVEELSETERGDQGFGSSGK